MEDRRLEPGVRGSIPIKLETCHPLTKGMEIRRTRNGISIDRKENPGYCCKKAGPLKVYWVLCFMHPKVWLMATSCMELQKITLIFNIMRTKHVILFESVWLFPNSDLWFCLGTELCAIVPDGWLANGVWAVVGFTLLWATSHCGMLCFQLIVFVFLVLL